MEASRLPRLLRAVCEAVAHILYLLYRPGNGACGYIGGFCDLLLGPQYYWLLIEKAIGMEISYKYFKMTKYCYKHCKCNVRLIPSLQGISD